MQSYIKTDVYVKTKKNGKKDTKTSWVIRQAFKRIKTKRFRFKSYKV